MMQAAAAMSAYWFLLHRGGWRFGESLATDDPLYLQATTACLSHRGHANRKRVSQPQ
jgi:hypothetical protein